MAQRRDYYESLLSNPNVQRALASIRAAEGTAKYKDPYSVGFGGRKIDDLSSHPGILSSFRDNFGNKNKTSAAGGYQFLNKSWGDMERQLGLPDFGPTSQDIAAVGLLDRSGALDNVLSGDIDGFVKDANGTWASLPGSPYNQPTRSKSFMRDAWNNYTPPADIPNANGYAATPTPRPSEDPFSALLTPASYQAPSFPATSSPVQREAFPDVSPVSFDTGRFGTPAPAAFDQSRFGNPAPANSYFDYSGLLSDPQQQPGAFDEQRLGPTAPVATTPQQLQRGLLDQQLNAGILPDLMAPATNWPGQAPATTPTVEQPAMGDYEPASIKTSGVQPPAVQSGLMSMPEYRQVQEQQSLLGGPMQHSTPAEFQAYADRTRQSMQNRSLGGGLLGGLLGGLTLGPVGAIAGGLLGKTVANRSFFPEAPPKNPNSTQQKTGYAGLNESGRRSYSESKQFRDAVDGKMSAGLW
jgi:muramidase (phage lysozyme)